MAEQVSQSLRIRDWDTATKFAGILALIAGGIWTVWLHYQTARQQANAAEVESQKPFAAKRLEVYEKLATLSAAVVQRDLPEQTRKARRQELDQLVNGPLALVAENKVFAAMADFVDCVDHRRCAKGSPALYARDVARACRTSLEQSWKVSLPPVPASDKLP
jgi:hypothetical protein